MAFVRNCLVFFLLAHSCAASAPLAPLELRLEENRVNIVRLQQEKRLLQEELRVQREQRDKLAAARRQARDALDRIIADTADTAPDPTDTRRYQQQRRALAQAETALKNAEAAVRELTDCVQLADVLISNISTIVARQRAELEEQKQGAGRSALDIALNKALLKNQEQIAATQAANEAAREEINRLRALLLEIMSAEEPPLETTPSGTADAPGDESAGQSAPANDIAEPGEEQLAAERKYAREEYQRLLSMFEQPDPEQRPGKRVTISGHIDGRIRYSSDETMAYLGYGQYHLETELPAGEVTFLLDGKHWKQKVRKRDNNERFVVIYDVADPKLPRLVVFKKSLVSDEPVDPDAEGDPVTSE